MSRALFEGDGRGMMVEGMGGTARKRRRKMISGGGDDGGYEIGCSWNH